MEHAAGVVLVVLGALLLVFGNAVVRRDGQARWSLRAAADSALKWGMGASSLLFGLGLIFDRVHFY